MPKLRVFQILLSNASGVFYSGSVVHGQVLVELVEPMKMRGIQLHFEGKARVHWTEEESTGTGDDKRTTTTSYTAEEVYIDQNVLLFGIWTGQGRDTSELPEGTHTFPFQFQLPQGLPSSYESSTGRVRYTMRCKIDKPWKFDHTTKMPFTIIGILDLNLQPSYSQRMQAANSKNLCCLCCKSGPIEATFHIDRQGYVPGEAIRLYAEISNGSSRKIDKSYVNLTMVTNYHATTKTRTDVKELGRVVRPGIVAHGEDVWSGEEQLLVPPLPPSFLLGCSIIDINYILKLNVDPSGPALDLEIPFEIVIGNIPLAQVVERFPPIAPTAPPPGQLPSALTAEEPYPAPLPTSIPNLPPPSYAESFLGPVDTRDVGDTQHTYGNMQFAPAYTYYNWGHTPGGTSALPQACGDMLAPNKT